MGTGIVTWANDPKSKEVPLYYEGSDTIYEGYALCYNHDTTTNWTGVSSADLTSETTTTAEGYQNEGKFIRVEKPAAANRRFFAGVVSGKSNGVSGPAGVDVYEPNGSIVPVYTDVSVTIGDPCYLEPSAYTFTNVNTAGGIQVGWFDETVDRSSTAGLALAKITGPNVWAGGDVQSARSRTSAQLPTSAIWQNFDLADLRTNPFSGSFLETDFNRGDILADDIFQGDTTAAVFALPGSGGIGELTLFTSADNEEAAVQWNCPITVSGGNKWALEARVKVENITDARATCVLGLKFRTAELAGDVVADDGAALTDGDFVGFVRFAADGDIWDFIYDEGSQSTNVHDADYHTAVANTYVTLGMYFNGTTIQGYINGTATGTAISASDIAAADFPTGAVVVPTLAVKGDNAADFDYIIDWIRCAQHA